MKGGLAMGLVIYKGAKGTLRPTWWGRVNYKGKAHEKNLGVQIAGVVPMDDCGNVALSQTGDKAFEQSRKAAQRVLEAWRKAIRTNPAELQESAYKVHTGVSLAGVPLAKLIEKWQGMKRQYTPSPGRVSFTRSTFDGFAKFAREYANNRGKRCETLNDVTPEMAAAWFDSIKATFAWGTVKDKMHIMSGAFRRWSTNGQTNPFGDIVLRGNKEAGEEKKRTERKALTPEQFARFMDAARENERLYPLVVCAAFTGMRIGDVCCLAVADVDLNKNEIDCVTAKAGVRVRIPILSPELRDVLREHCAIPADGTKPSTFVFPWAAAQYKRNRTAIVRAVKPYFARAVFGGEPAMADAELIETDEPPRSIETAIADSGWTEAKAARVLEVYNRFKAGEQSKQIADAMGIARGQVSNYLKDAEQLTGERLRPGVAHDAPLGSIDLIQRTRLARSVGKHAASIWGWHNLRHNFITCALNNGVPIHKVASIVGHKTINITAGYADTQTDTRPATQLPAPAAPSIDAIIAGMSEADRKKLAAKLLGL